jgi:hypothetical protein
VINLAPIVELGVPYTLDLADPISTAVLTAVASDPGGDPLTYGWDLDGDGQFDDGTGQGALFAPTDLGVFAPSVEVQDDAGATTVQSYLVTVGNTGSATNPPDDATIPPADDSDPPSDSDPAETGKISGRAVIGRLISMSSTEIVVAVRIGPDFTHVRINIDPVASEPAASLDAEAYTVGSKIVVVADSNVLSGNAIALKIKAIPSAATRTHDRVIVSKTGDGNAAVLVSGDDDSDDTTVIDDEAGQFNAGDQVVVIKHRDNSNRRNEKSRVIAGNNNIKDRLEEFARKKFDDDDTDSSGLIDRLAEKRREKEQARIDKAKRHADEAVRRAAEQADEQPRRRRQIL